MIKIIDEAIQNIMSFVEKQIDFKNILLEDEINRIRAGNLNNGTLASEIADIRRKLEEGLERISIIENNLGISKHSEKIKIKKLNKTDVSTKEIFDIILVQNDDVVPDGYESVLIITEQGHGDLIYINRDILLELCKEILINQVGQELSFPEYISTGKYAILNSNGEWELKETEATITNNDEDE